MIDKLRISFLGIVDTSKLLKYSENEYRLFSGFGKEFVYVKILKNTTTIDLNPRKFYYQENKFLDLDYKKLVVVLKEISKELGLSYEELLATKVLRVDIGFNIFTKEKPFRYLDCLNSCDNTEPISYPKETIEFRKKKKEYSIKFYDKSKEVIVNNPEIKKGLKKTFSKLNCLRYEIAIQNRLDKYLRVYSLKELLENWNTLGEYLLEEFSKVKIRSHGFTFDGNVMKGIYKKKQIQEIALYRMIKADGGVENTLSLLNKESVPPNRFSELKRYFERIWDKYSSQDLQYLYREELANKIRKKVDKVTITNSVI